MLNVKPAREPDVRLTPAELVAMFPRGSIPGTRYGIEVEAKKMIEGHIHLWLRLVPIVEAR